MSILSSELRKAHQTFYDESLEILREYGIGHLLEYLEHIREADYSKSQKEFLRDTSPRAATRIYPGADQDIVFASLNPKVVEEAKAAPSDTLRRLSKHTNDIERYAIECAKDYQRNYLDRSVKGTRKNGYHELFDLLNHVGLISYPENGRSGYLQNQYPSKVFSDIYFTNWYKFGTESESEKNNLPDEIADLSYSCLINELEAIEGSVVFAFGDDIQSQLGNHVSQPLTEEAPEYDDVTSTERHGYAYETDIAGGTTVITVGHQGQGWGQSRGAGNEDLPQIRDTLDAIDLKFM
jgi:hypothetical protein